VAARRPRGDITPAGLLVNLGRIRQMRGLTQVQVAERAGVPQTSIALMETGRQSCSITTLLKLCAGLGCSADELLGRIAPMVPPSQHNIEVALVPFVRVDVLREASSRVMREIAEAGTDGSC
jgi:transcriptional regulator with XRE-family HTH domain